MPTLNLLQPLLPLYVTTTDMSPLLISLLVLHFSVFFKGEACPFLLTAEWEIELKKTAKKMGLL